MFRDIHSHDDLAVGRYMSILILGRSCDFQNLQSEGVQGEDVRDTSWFGGQTITGSEAH